ncbi:MAG: metallophosphoesterase family protein [Candidatus Heimdallarchaeaceae archaeon]
MLHMEYFSPKEHINKKEQLLDNHFEDFKANYRLDPICRADPLLSIEIIVARKKKRNSLENIKISSLSTNIDYNSKEYTRINAFSDWHVQPVEKLVEWLNDFNKPIDFILYAGDATYRFLNQKENANYFQVYSLFSKYGFFLVGGNDTIPLYEFKANKVHPIEMQLLEINDEFIIIGHGGIVKESNEVIGDLEEFDNLVKKTLNKKYENKKIIILSHSPPYSCLDYSIRGFFGHRGSKALREFILNDQRVILCVCGHCHHMGGDIPFLVLLLL